MAHSASSWDEFLIKQFVDPISFLYRCVCLRCVKFIAICVARLKKRALCPSPAQPEALTVPHILTIGCKHRSGARTIVLAFDDRAHVPLAKAITQRKRREKLEPLIIHEWPNVPPVPWILAMINNDFKHQVIEYIRCNLPPRLHGLHNCEIMFDYDGLCYQRLTIINDTECWIEDMERECLLGEADVKFSYWTRKLAQPIAVLSIDGDYVPIALAMDYPIFIFRHAWIDIQTLKQYLGLKVPELMLLMALTGTDFSRQLPQIKPLVLFSGLHTFRKILSKAVNSVDLSIDFGFGMQLVAALYHNKFSKHLPTRPPSLDMTLKVLTRSKLSKSTIERLPTQAFVNTCLKNASFVLRYWTQPINAVFTEETMPTFGFTRAVSGLVVWEDEGPHTIAQT